MKNIRVAINGFGRIGRITFRALLNRPGIEVVALNDLTDTATLGHLLKYDTIHGRFNGTVQADSGYLVVNGSRIKVFAEKDPSKLKWKEMEVDFVIESTGRFTDRAGAELHLSAGARKVILSAPSKDGDIKTVVFGVNENTLTASDKIISNASCTTNNVALMVKILDENWGIETGYITTVHAYTGDQNLQDSPHKDLRRARAAAESIIPTTTGAAKAMTELFPHLDGKLGSTSLRVPVSDGSITELTCLLKNTASKAAINTSFFEASNASMKNVLEYTEDPIVSSDIVGNTNSCIFDALLTSVVGNMVRVVGWYDNEMGYSTRLAELIVKLGTFN